MVVQFVLMLSNKYKETFHYLPSWKYAFLV